MSKAIFTMNIHNLPLLWCTSYSSQIVYSTISNETSFMIISNENCSLSSSKLWLCTLFETIEFSTHTHNENVAFKWERLSYIGHALGYLWLSVYFCFIRSMKSIQANTCYAVMMYILQNKNRCATKGIWMNKSKTPLTLSTIRRRQEKQMRRIWKRGAHTYMCMFLSLKNRYERILFNFTQRTDD